MYWSSINMWLFLCVNLTEWRVQVISAEQKSSKHWELTGEGREIAEQGSHEARVFNAIPAEGLPQNQLMVRALSIGVSHHHVLDVNEYH